RQCLHYPVAIVIPSALEKVAEFSSRVRSGLREPRQDRAAAGDVVAVAVDASRSCERVVSVSRELPAAFEMDFGVGIFNEGIRLRDTVIGGVVPALRS